MIHSRHVLIVDDDPDIRAILSELLTEEGYVVSLQSHARKTLVDLAVLAPDLFILDYFGSAECSGWELFELLRGAAQFRDTPVLFCTGAVPQMAARSAQLAAMRARVLFKPFDIDELLAEVARMVPTYGEVASVRSLAVSASEKRVGVCSLTDSVSEDLTLVTSTRRRAPLPLPLAPAPS